MKIKGYLEFITEEFVSKDTGVNWGKAEFEVKEMFRIFTKNEALKTGAIILNDFLNSNDKDTRFMAGGKVQPKDLTKINNFNNVQKGVDYYSYSDNSEKQEKADRWFELFVINQKEKQLNKTEFNEFMKLSNELAWEDLD